MAEPPAEHAGERNRDQQVRRDRAETQPHGTTSRDERDDGVDQSDRGERIEHGGDDVDGEERER